MSPLDRLEGRWECSNLARRAAVILYLSVLGDGRVLRLVNSRPHRPPRLRSSGLTKPLVNADVDKRSGHLRRCSFDAEEDDPSVYRHPHLPAAWLGQSFEASVGGEAGSS